MYARIRVHGRDTELRQRDFGGVKLAEVRVHDAYAVEELRTVERTLKRGNAADRVGHERCPARARQYSYFFTSKASKASKVSTRVGSVFLVLWMPRMRCLLLPALPAAAAYVSARRYTSAFVSIRQHTSAYLLALAAAACAACCCCLLLALQCAAHAS
jgi:hypothetical protein